MDEKYMKEVMKKFPGTKWAELAAFHLIDNKLCGDWQGFFQVPGKKKQGLTRNTRPNIHNRPRRQKHFTMPHPAGQR